MTQNIFHVLGAVAGAFYILFLPGFAVSFLFFARGAIDIIERIALSFALSVAIVPLVSFYLNLVGVKIKFWTVFLETLAIILISAVAAKFTGRFDKKNEHEPHENKYKK
jgi:uncharacterized membrane protein